MGILAAALVGSFAWIIKVEVGQAGNRNDIDDLEREVAELKMDLKEAKTIADEVRANKVDLTRVIVTLDVMKETLRDIKDKLDAAP